MSSTRLSLLGDGGKFTLSPLDVLQGFSFFLQMGFTLILATLDGLDVGLLRDVIGEDDCDDEVSRLVDNGFVQCFMDYGISVSKNDVLYFNAIARNGIYEIDMHDLVPNVNSIYSVSNKRVKHNLDSTYLWHCRLAHINKKRIKQLQQDGLLKSTDDESFDKYESCLSGKITKKHFPHSNERAKVLLRIIHTDVCGPLRRGSIPMLATSLLLHLHTTTPITIGHNSHHRCSLATPQ
ncbi:retrotransposon protein, putative, ty1-copia subclass [Tanacetum coccineum]